MTTEEALNRHFVSTGIYAEGCTRDDWYAGHAVYLEVGAWKVPFPILRRSGPIILHDLHHMLTGYPPTILISPTDPSSGSVPFPSTSRSA